MRTSDIPIGRRCGRPASWPALGLVLALTISGCSAAAGGTPAASSAPSPTTAPIDDVGDYRGGIARTGSMPGPGPAATPIKVWRYADGVGLNLPVIVASGWVIVPVPRGLAALDARTGAPAWQLALPADVAAPLTAASGVLYAATTDSVLRAFSLSTRRPLWTFDGVIDGSQVSVTGATAYVGTTKHELVALGVQDGRPQWRLAAPTSTAKIAIDGGVAVVGGDGGPRATAIDLATHRVRWVLDTKAQRVATPVLADGSAYVAGLLSGGAPGAVSRLFSLDVASGTVRWTFTPPGSDSMAAFAVTASDVVVGTDGDQGVLYDVDRATGRVRWQTALGTAIDRPVVVGDTVYVGTGTGGLHAVDLRTGHERWTTAIDGYSEGVVVDGGFAFVTTHDSADTPGAVTALATR
jgi:outer membrane protein assembly factor BamB